jgi:hypothetical protein
MVNFMEMLPACPKWAGSGTSYDLSSQRSKCALDHRAGAWKKGAFDPTAKVAAIDVPSFRPFSRINRTFKDTGESAARSMIFGEVCRPR